MENNINDMFDKKNWAVVGATNNKNKFGNKIYNLLNEKGYKVYPVNPVYDEVEGEKCFNNLSEIEGQVDCINFVVPPARGVEYIKEAITLGIKELWFQPGTFDEELLKLCEANDLTIVHHSCVLVELPKRG